MSEKRTRIKLPNQQRAGFPGLSAWGEKTRDEMIELVRDHAEWLRQQAAAIELAADSDFRIDLVRGQHVPKVLKVIQEGRHDIVE